MSQKKAAPPAQAPQTILPATKQQLIEQYNRQAGAVESVNAAITLQLTASSDYTGVIEQYHEVGGFLLAQRPAHIRVIGQAPVVGKNIFDMVSDGETFRIFIPSKNKFLTGPARLEHPARKPIENLRPQHILDAIFLEKIPAEAPVLFEIAEGAGGPGYVLTVLGKTGEGLEILRKVRFEGRDLSIGRIDFFQEDGRVASAVEYKKWEPAGTTSYPRAIVLERRQDHYSLSMKIRKLTVNEAIPPGRFELPQPPGTELVRVGEEPETSGGQP